MVLPEAHDALTDQADWNAAYWDMEPEACRRLEEAVTVLYDLSAHGIAVRAIWVSDKVQKSETLSIKAMCDVVREGRLGTHTRYEIPKLVV